MKLLRLASVTLLVALSLLSAKAQDQLCPKYGQCVPASAFECEAIDRSSLIYRVCYNEANRYMIVQLGQNRTDYHYCAIPADVVAAFLAAESMGRFYNQNIKSSSNDGLYDCRTHPVPIL